MVSKCSLATRLLCAIPVLVIAAPAMATEITFAYEGVVWAVDEDLAGGPVEVGDSFRGTFTFDSDTPPTFGVDSALYHGAVLETSARVGDYAGFSESGRINVVDDREYSPSDAADLFIVHSDPIRGPDINGFTDPRFALVVERRPRTAPPIGLIDGLALPTEPPDLALSTYTTVYIQFEGFRNVQATLSSLTQVSDPRLDIVPGGQGQSAVVLGGASSPGGIDALFADTTGGVLSADLSVLTTEDAISGTVDFPAADFLLPADPLYTWDIEYDGSLDGPVTLSFGYDDTTLLPGWTEDVLGIYHYVDTDGDGIDDAWMLEPGTVDLDEDTITVTVDELSPFALGIVPEPAKGILGISGLLVFAAARRSRA